MNRILFFLLLILMLIGGTSSHASEITVGSKKFTENYILAEIFSQTLEANGFEVHKKLGLGGTALAFEALRSAEIDLYPEYTGTLQEVLKREENAQKTGQVLYPLEPLGFNNTYALGLLSKRAGRLGVQKISDLKRFPNLKIAFDHEFMNRPDGWKGLKKTYSLPLKVVTLDHGVIYEALLNEEIDVIIVYSTDAKILKYDVQLLEDDKSYFPRYDGVALIRASLPLKAKRALQALSGQIDDAKMRKLNALVEIEGKTFSEAAGDFLGEGGVLKKGTVERGRSFLKRLLPRVSQHLYLVFLSLSFAVALAVPLGYWVYRFQKFAGPVLGVVGVLQTIPSLALVVLMIPLVGIGSPAALLALFLYSLLPILRNTYIGFNDLPGHLVDAAEGIGLSERQKLYWVEFPLAFPVILAGIRTAGVISIGTATLAALIGAGGLGDPIITGLSLNDMGLILEGAVPAALLAVIFELGFSAVEKKFHRWKPN